MDQSTQLGIGGCHEPGCIDEDGLGCGSVGLLLFTLRGRVGFLHGLVYRVSLHSFSPEVCFDKMWSGRYTCPVPYIDSDLIKSFVSIIFMCRAYSTARTTSHSVMDLSLTEKNDEIVQSKIMTTNKDSCLNCAEETAPKAVLRMILEGCTYH